MNLTDEMVRALRVVARLNKSGAANVYVAKANYPGDIDKVDYPWATTGPSKSVAAAKGLPPETQPFVESVAAMWRSGAALVRALERRGLVEVSYGVLTGKAINVRITPEGEAALAELDAVRAEA